MSKALLVLFSAFFLGGCATTASVNYKVASPAQADKGIAVRVEDFSDARPAEEKGEIGKMLNEYGGAVGVINEPPTLLADLKTALEAELKNAGYSFGGSDGKGIAVKPTLLYIHCDASNNGKGKLRARFVVTEGGETVMDHVYDADGEAFNLLGYATNPAITNATKKLMGMFLADLDAYAKS